MAALVAGFDVLNILRICGNCQRAHVKNGVISSLGFVPVREKHWDPKWRKLRAMKVRKIELPDFAKLRREANMSLEEQRAHFKREGLNPPRTFQERGLTLASTSSIFEPYVPPEGDGVASLISGKRAKQRFTELEKKGKSFMQLRKIKQFEDFDSGQFADTALEIYQEAHDLLQNVEKNEDRLHELVTEKAYPEMVWRLQKKTFRWQYVESVEPPRVVHVRTVDMLSKENVYAQVTVRINAKQILALYDRFGRLMFGSENVVKDTLEYIVFEKHISDENSHWRIHGKVVPDWMPQRQTVLRTMRVPDEFGEDTAASSEESMDKDKAEATA